jgi:hypothetical protein
MQCTRCGLELPQEARFCSRCGAAVVMSQQQAVPQAQQAPEPAPAQASGYSNVYGAGPAVGSGQGYGPGYGAGYSAGFRSIVPDTNRVARHVQTLALMWGVFAGYRFLTKFFGLTLFHTWARHSNWASWNPGGDWMGMWMPFALTTLLFWCALAALTAYGLSSRQPWARGLALVCGVWALIHPLLGTALGIYTLWVLGPSLSGLEYDRLARPAQS